MGIEKLTDEERNILLDLAGTWANRPLRIIDECDAEVTRLTEALAAAEQRTRTELARVDAAESECAALRAEVKRLRTLNRENEQRWLASESEGMAAESSLAAATELLRRWLSGRGNMGGVLTGETEHFLRTFLAAQPAAPTEDEGPDVEADPDYPAHRKHFSQPPVRSLNSSCTAPLRRGLHQIATIDGVKLCTLCGAAAQPAAPARTDVERHVLDAVFERAYCEQEDGCAGGPSETYYYETVAVFEAYRIARREADK